MADTSPGVGLVKGLIKFVVYLVPIWWAFIFWMVGAYLLKYDPVPTIIVGLVLGLVSTVILLRFLLPPIFRGMEQGPVVSRVQPVSSRSTAPRVEPKPVEPTVAENRADPLATLNGADLVVRDDEVRARVSQSLDAIVAGDGGIKVLIDRLYDGMTFDGQFIRLRHWGDDAWNELLKKRLLAEALARSQSPQAIEPLARIVRGYCAVGQFDEIVHAGSIRALGSSQNEDAASSLQAALRDLFRGVAALSDEQRSETSATFNALMTVPEYTVPVMVEMLAASEDPVVRSTAAHLLAIIANRPNVPAALLTPAIPALEAAQQTDDYNLATAVQRALGRIRPREADTDVRAPAPSATGATKVEYRHHPTLDTQAVRDTARMAWENHKLGRPVPAAWREVAFAAMHHPDVIARRWGAWGLQAFGGPEAIEAIEAIEAALSDEDDTVRRNVNMTLSLLRTG